MVFAWIEAMIIGVVKSASEPGGYEKVGRGKRGEQKFGRQAQVKQAERTAVEDAVGACEREIQAFVANKKTLFMFEMLKKEQG